MYRKLKYDLTELKLSVEEDKELDEVKVTIRHGEKAWEYYAHNCVGCALSGFINWLESEDEV